MKLQQDEEDEGKGVTALKACAEAGDLDFFLGGRPVTR
jgi:hypothetical protein